MSNNSPQREHIPCDEKMNETAESQAALKAGARALPLHPRSPSPHRHPDPATAPAPVDVRIGMDDNDIPAQGGAEDAAVASADVQRSMDNNDVPAQGGAENPAPGAEERALVLAITRAGHQPGRGNVQSRGQNRRRGPGDRRTPRTQAHWNRGRQGGHRGHHGSHHRAPNQTFYTQNFFNFANINVADAAAIARLWGGPPRREQNREMGPRRGGGGQQ